MLDMEEVKEFSNEIVNHSNIFSIMDESIASRIVLLQNNDRTTDRWISTYTNTN